MKALAGAAILRLVVEVNGQMLSAKICFDGLKGYNKASKHISTERYHHAARALI